MKNTIILWKINQPKSISLPSQRISTACEND